MAYKAMGKPENKHGADEKDRHINVCNAPAPFKNDNEKRQ